MRAVAFIRDGITVAAVAANLAASLGVPVSAVVAVKGEAGGSVGYEEKVVQEKAAAVTAQSTAAVAYLDVYARGGEKGQE